MDKYIQVHFAAVDAIKQDILIAELASIGFDGFEQGPDYLNAFLPENSFNRLDLHTIPMMQTHRPTISLIEPRNWNEEWEKSFEPVIIDEFCAIRASFHPPVAGVQHEIVITPKMSFGTGHHATTYQMIKLMKEIDFSNKTVVDFGTGTGVLAILAYKLGAAHICAIDNDEWSINNARENVENNGSSTIQLNMSDTLPNNELFDIILANINKHVILENLPEISKQLRPGGVVLLSGLLQNDQREIVDAALKNRLFVKTQSQKYDWIALCFTNVNQV